MSSLIRSGPKGAHPGRRGFARSTRLVGLPWYTVYEWLTTWGPFASFTANVVVALGGLFIGASWWWGRRAARVPFYSALKSARDEGTDVWINRGRDDEFVGKVVGVTDRTVEFNDGYGELVEWDLSLIHTQEVFQREDLCRSAGAVFEIGRVGHPLVDISGSRALSNLRIDYEEGRCSFTVEENERTARLFWSAAYGKRYRCRFSPRGKDVGLPYEEFESVGEGRTWRAKRGGVRRFHDVVLRVDGQPVKGVYSAVSGRG